jgi:hypothetical protein
MLIISNLGKNGSSSCAQVHHQQANHQHSQFHHQHTEEIFCPSKHTLLFPNTHYHWKTQAALLQPTVVV